MCQSTTTHHTHTHTHTHCNTAVCDVLCCVKCSSHPCWRGMPSVLGLCSVVVAVYSSGCVWRGPLAGRGHWFGMQTGTSRLEGGG